MKYLITFLVTIFHLLLASLPGTFAKLAECRGYMTGPNFVNCPDCKKYKAEGVTPLAANTEPTLWTCKGKPLNVAECAHQCVCDPENGKLSCRSWEGCSGATVTNSCKCKWIGDNKDGHCEPGSENKLWKDGGTCFCADHWTEGNPPPDPPAKE